MTSEQLIAEGRKLQRTTVILTDRGTGTPSAKWYGFDQEGERGWLTVAAATIPKTPASVSGYLTLYTSAAHGRVETTRDWPSHEGLPLFAREENILPPIDAVFLLGSSDVGDWLKSNNWERDWGCNDNFADSGIVDEYERVWYQEFPVYRDDVVAALGGWHMSWPDGDWFENVEKQLLIFTIRDSEPYVEAWFERGQIIVRQRRT